MAKKKNYSYAERKAYYVGVGAGIGHHRKHGSVIKSMQGKVKESFKNGLDCGLSNPTKTVAKINKKRGRKYGEGKNEVWKEIL